VVSCILLDTIVGVATRSIWLSEWFEDLQSRAAEDGVARANRSSISRQAIDIGDGSINRLY
jgi:hypothetical protein